MPSFPEQTAPLITTESHVDRGVELWRAWLAGDGDPYYDQGNGDKICFFCAAWLGEKHDLGCIYMQARKLCEEAEALC